MILELRTELSVREAPDGTRISGPPDIYAQLETTGSLAQECFCVLCLDTRNRLIRRHLVSLGTLNQSLVHPREVFRPAIRDGAAAIILAHNHPSGDPSPSAEDLAITGKLIEAGGLLDIQVLDHLVIGDGRYCSMREQGLARFN